MSSSDLTISTNTRAVFHCDGTLVHVQFVLNGEYIGKPLVLTRAEASEIGREIAATGVHERFPISGISTNDVRGFGIVLKRYGDTAE